MGNKLLLSAFMVGLLGCNDTADKFTGEYKAFQGYWHAASYGKSLHIVADAVLSYQYTDAHCILLSQETNLSAEELNKRFVVSDTSLVELTYPDVSEIDDSGIVYESANALPHPCQGDGVIKYPSDQDNPEVDARIFVDNFSQYYIDFGLSGTDWSEISQTLLSNVDKHTSNETLFTLFSEAITPLQNGHVAVYDGQSLVSSRHNDKPMLTDKLAQEFAEAQQLTLPLSEAQAQRRVTYVETELAKIRETVLGYSDTPQGIKANDSETLLWFTHGDVGYLNVQSLSGFGDSSHARTLEEVDKLFAIIAEDFQHMRGIVLDLRFNDGGYGFLARAIAGHFTAQTQLAYREQARLGGGFGPAKEVYVVPREPVMEQPLVVLVSHTTASAAELLTLMMKSLPHAVLVGEPTQGMLSGVLEKRLPNGFIFGLSNLKRVSFDNQWYEFHGIPVDMDVPFFPIDDRNQRVDAGLEAALAYLNAL